MEVIMSDNRKIIYNAEIKTSSIYLENEDIVFKIVLETNSQTLAIHLSDSSKQLNDILKRLFYVTDTIDFNQLEGTFVRLTEQNGEIITISNIITDKHLEI
jgi:hypothetical protein